MAALFSNAQMTAMRAFFVGLACKDNCLIERPSGTQDALGSPIPGFVTIGTFKANVAQPNATVLAAYASQIGALVTWQVDFPYPTNVRKNDQLTVNGRKMLVQVLTDALSFPVFTTVLASTIE